MAHDTRCMDAMDTKATPAVVQRYTRIGLIDIKSNQIINKTLKIRSHEAHPEKHRNIKRILLFLVEKRSSR